jgi:pSer/pThr/pTyr-binding forkhead associated (FHA) protein
MALEAESCSACGMVLVAPEGTDTQPEVLPESLVGATPIEVTAPGPGARTPAPALRPTQTASPAAVHSKSGVESPRIRHSDTDPAPLKNGEGAAREPVARPTGLVSRLAGATPRPGDLDALPRTTGRAAIGGYSMADAPRSCPKCGAAVPASFLFCGRCGTKMAPQAAAREGLGQTQFFGALQAVGKAKLVLIKGEGLDGISYQLNAKEHVAGRSQGVILFPDDRFLSSRHANFYYDEGKLFLRDEGSVNGVFIRIRQPVELQQGDTFLAGEELMSFESIDLPRPAEMVHDDGTVFYGTPMRDGVGCRLVQILLGGRMGMVYVPTKTQILIGRDACDLNFPRDRFISGRHCRIELQGKSFYLSDLGSKNGTYLRLRGERELVHGDYVFIGQQLFRAEITAF